MSDKKQYHPDIQRYIDQDYQVYLEYENTTELDFPHEADQIEFLSSLTQKTVILKRIDLDKPIVLSGIPGMSCRWICTFKKNGRKE